MVFLSHLIDTNKSIMVHLVQALEHYIANIYLDFIWIQNKCFCCPPDSLWVRKIFICISALFILNDTHSNVSGLRKGKNLEEKCLFTDRHSHKFLENVDMFDLVNSFHRINYSYPILFFPNYISNWLFWVKTHSKPTLPHLIVRSIFLLI